MLYTGLLSSDILFSILVMCNNPAYRYIISGSINSSDLYRPHRPQLLFYIFHDFN